MPVLMHMAHKYACTQSHRTFAEKTRLAPVKFQVPSNAAFQSWHSLEREERLNYKSRGFNQPCRLARSFVWSLQKWIACLYQDGPCFGFVRLSLTANKPLLACHQELSGCEESSWRVRCRNWHHNKRSLLQGGILIMLHVYFCICDQ